MKLTVGLIVTAFLAVTGNSAKIYIEGETQRGAQDDQMMKITASPQFLKTQDLID